MDLTWHAIGNSLMKNYISQTLSYTL